MKQTVTAHQKFIRQTPRKLRLVADLVRGMSVDQAMAQLNHSPKRAASTIKHVLTQAQNNAVNNNQLNPGSLVVNEVQIQEGPTFKRWQPVSRGRAHPILKRSSHIKIVLHGDTQDAGKTQSKKK